MTLTGKTYLVARKSGLGGIDLLVRACKIDKSILPESRGTNIAC